MTHLSAIHPNLVARFEVREYGTDYSDGRVTRPERELNRRILRVVRMPLNYDHKQKGTSFAVFFLQYLLVFFAVFLYIFSFFSSIFGVGPPIDT